MASSLVDSPLSRPFPAGARDSAGLKLAFNMSSGAGSKPCAFIKATGGGPGLKMLVRHEQPQGLRFAAGRQSGIGDVKMGERLLAIVPKLRRPAQFGEWRDPIRSASLSGRGFFFFPGIFHLLVELLVQIGPASVVGDQCAAEILWNLVIDKGHSRKPAQ